MISLWYRPSRCCERPNNVSKDDKFKSKPSDTYTFSQRRTFAPKPNFLPRVSLQWLDQRWIDTASSSDISLSGLVDIFQLQKVRGTLHHTHIASPHRREIKATTSISTRLTTITMPLSLRGSSTDVGLVDPSIPFPMIVILGSWSFSLSALHYITRSWSQDGFMNRKLEVYDRGKTAISIPSSLKSEEVI